MKYELNNEKLTIYLNGQITSNNSLELNEEIQKIRLENKHSFIEFDIEEVEYISSAGLRFLLAIKKEETNFKVINASQSVYDIFSVTGFTEIMDISKALQVISIEGKELIGQGYMGKIYRLDNDSIIKVVYRGDSLSNIMHERELAKKAFVLGIPTAISYDVVKVKEGGYGSIFELVKSDSLSGLMRKNPQNLDEYIKIYSDLLIKISNTYDESNSLPNKKDDAYIWLNGIKDSDVFDKKTLEKLESLINSIPDAKNVIHGDYHVKNVMMQNNEALLIDMDTIGAGHPIFELTAMFLAYVGYPSTEPGNLMSFLGITDEQADKLFKTTLKNYFKNKTEQEINVVLDKCAILGYMWLVYKTLTFEKDNLVRINHSRDVVISLIDKYDSLDL